MTVYSNEILLTEEEARKMFCPRLIATEFTDVECKASLCMAWRWDRKVKRFKDKRLSLPIEDLNLSVRALNSLRLMDISTLYELVRLHEGFLHGTRGCGKMTVREIKLALKEIGLQFNMCLEHSQTQEIVGVGYCGLAGKPM